MKSDIYIPINCNLYDQLEAFATLKTRIAIAYREGENVAQVDQILLTDFKTKTDGEFGYFFSKQDSFTIRLDKLISINGSNVKDEFGNSYTLPNKK